MQVLSLWAGAGPERQSAAGLPQVRATTGASFLSLSIERGFLWRPASRDERACSHCLSRGVRAACCYPRLRAEACATEGTAGPDGTGWVALWACRGDETQGLKQERSES